MEMWKDIELARGKYKISSHGKVWNSTKKRYLKGTITNGYHTVGLPVDNGYKNFRVHRLVAIYFIPNTENKPSVNHIDENKLNNKIENLEWCTQKENTNHGTAIARRQISRKSSKKWKDSLVPVVAIDIKTGEKTHFNSIMDAERMGFNSGNISKCINGKIKKHGNHYWHKINLNREVS